jgi:hypothetical protein
MASPTATMTTALVEISVRMPRRVGQRQPTLTSPAGPSTVVPQQALLGNGMSIPPAAFLFRRFGRGLLRGLVLSHGIGCVPNRFGIRQPGGAGESRLGRRSATRLAMSIGKTTLW